MQAIITSAAIAGGSFWAITQNHAALSRIALGVITHALRAIGLV